VLYTRWIRDDDKVDNFMILDVRDLSKLRSKQWEIAGNKREKSESFLGGVRYKNIEC